MTTPTTPDQRAEKITVKGRTCRVSGSESSWYVVDDDAREGCGQYLRRDGRWWNGTGGFNLGYWTSKAATLAFLETVRDPAPPIEPKCPECDGDDRELFEERAFAQRFLMSIRRNPSPPTPKISGALDFISMDCPNKSDFIKRDEKGDYHDPTLAAMWWAWCESRKPTSRSKS